MPTDTWTAYVFHCFKRDTEFGNTCHLDQFNEYSVVTHKLIPSSITRVCAIHHFFQRKYPYNSIKESVIIARNMKVLILMSIKIIFPIITPRVDAKYEGRSNINRPLSVATSE